MKKTEIIWVFGSSAAWKETFIHNILENPPKKTINELWWNEKRIFFIKESIKYIGQFENDPIIKKRKKIITEAEKIANQTNTIILIKWQDVDLDARLINRLQEKIPTIEHKIIFLHTNLETLYKRCQNKSWRTEEDEKKWIIGIKKWLLYQLDLLKKLNNIDIIAIDSTNKYKIIPFPPVIK
jgi:hypothetical protein